MIICLIISILLLFNTVILYMIVFHDVIFQYNCTVIIVTLLLFEVLKYSFLYVQTYLNKRTENLTCFSTRPMPGHIAILFSYSAIHCNLYICHTYDIRIHSTSDTGAYF